MLRLLDPVEDLELFEQAYNWRKRPKKHVQPDRMSFETFASPDPNQIVLGLFSKQLDAVYVLIEVEPAKYDVHFTARRGVDRQRLLDAAREIRDAFFENGAEQLSAWITPRNRAMRSFLSDLGFLTQGSKEFPCDSDTLSTTLPTQTRVFVNMAVKVNPLIGPLRSQTDHQTVVHDG